MTGPARLAAAVSAFALFGVSAAPAQQIQDEAAILEAIEKERAALIALGELEPEEDALRCERPCLDAMAEAYLDSLVANDASTLPISPRARITEDGVAIRPGEGFWLRATGLAQHRLNILDDYWSTAAGLAVMERADGVALLAYRLKIQDGEITEIEQFVVEPAAAAEGAGAMTPNMENLSVPRDDFLRRVDPSEQNSRTELVEIAQTYPDGLKAGSFEAVDAPFPDDAERMENGLILAGPRCTFNENCGNMKAQPSPERPTLRQRLLAVDEEQGIVFMWLDWMQASGQTLQVYEAFKIYAGQLHDVEAFIEHGDPAIYPGWPLD